MKTAFVHFVSVLIMLSLLVSIGHSQTPESNKEEQKKKEYFSLVEKLKEGDTSVHFGHLRRAYVEWKIAGGMMEQHPKRDAMVKAFQSNDHASAVKLAEEVLDVEFFNHNILGSVADSYKVLKDTEKSDRYNKLYHQAQHGLFLSGDGKTPETAYYVLTIAEEYRVMRELGLTPTMQSLNRKNGQAYDILSGRDSKGTTVDVYFNICFFFPC